MNDKLDYEKYLPFFYNSDLFFQQVGFMNIINLKQLADQWINGI